MAKIDDYSTALLPQEVIDMLDQIKQVLNYGKYQFGVVTAAPTWTGRLGEAVFMITGSTGRFYVCSSDQSSTSWSIVNTFTP